MVKFKRTCNFVSCSKQLIVNLDNLVEKQAQLDGRMSSLLHSMWAHYIPSPSYVIRTCVVPMFFSDRTWTVFYPMLEVSTSLLKRLVIWQKKSVQRFDC